MPEGTALSYFVVERFVPAPTLAGARAEGGRLRASARRSSRGGVGVRYVKSLLFLDDETSFCLFESESLEAVRLVTEWADLPYERIVPVLPVDFRTPPKGAQP
jgi:hypothetical protein